MGYEVSVAHRFWRKLAGVGNVDYSRHMSRRHSIQNATTLDASAQHEHTLVDGVDEPFVGWTQARVGCHWSRPLPDGRIVHTSTWQRGREDGYSLTINYNRAEYPDLPAVLAAFERLENEARASSPAAPTVEDVRKRVEGRPECADLKADLAAADAEVGAATARRRKLSERTLWSEEAAAVGYVGG